MAINRARSACRTSFPAGHQVAGGQPDVGQHREDGGEQAALQGQDHVTGLAQSLAQARRDGAGGGTGRVLVADVDPDAEALPLGSLGRVHRDRDCGRSAPLPNSCAAGAPLLLRDRPAGAVDLVAPAAHLLVQQVGHDRGDRLPRALPRGGRR
jgi:hypothetical protein